MFNWDDARIFLAIARGGSLSAAGRTLRVQQSTVGRRLTALEATLGVRLFDRTPKGFRPTRAGTVLQAHAQRMEDDALAAGRELVGREARIAGVVRVTAPQALGNILVAPLLARLASDHPEILVELVADNAIMSLSNREADLALRLGRPKQPLLVVRRIGDLVTALYASRDYVARRGRPRGRDLGGHDFVDYDEPTYSHGPLIQWFRQRARGGVCRARVNGSHGIASVLEVGLGVGALPCWLGDAIPALERVLPAQSYTQQLWLVLHRDLRTVARVRAVSDFLVRELQAASPRLVGESA